MQEQEEGEIVEPEQGQVVYQQQRRNFKPQKMYEMKSSNYKKKVCEHFKKGTPPIDRRQLQERREMFIHPPVGHHAAHLQVLPWRPLQQVSL
jgi:hypothetical protein